MKKNFRIVIALIIGFSLIHAFSACSNQFDELKKALGSTEIAEEEKKAETTEPQTTEPATTVVTPNPQSTEPKATEPATTVVTPTPQSTEPQTTDPKTTEPQTTDPQTTEPQTTDPQTTDPQTTEPQTTEPQTTDPQTTDPQTTDPQTTEPQTTDPQTTDPQTTDTDPTNPDPTNPENTSAIEPEADVTYTVEHWLENTDGRTYGLDVKATQSLSGKTDSATLAAAREYQGFTPEEIIQQTIKADGSTVVKVYYNRKRITYTFNAKGGKWSDNSEQKSLTGLYEALVPVIAEPAKAGARFCNWDTLVPQTFGLENKAYEAVWLTNSLTSYKIEHCLQNIYDDDYVIDSVQVRTAMPGEMTQAEAKTYTGFNTKSIMQNTVNADGSTIARVYYDRKNITYTFNLDSGYGTFADNTTSMSITKRYGAAVEVPKVIMSSYGMTVTGWSNSYYLDTQKTYVGSNKTFTAQYGTNNYDTITYLPAGTDGSAGTTGTYVYLGAFPQTYYETPPGERLPDPPLRRNPLIYHLYSDKNYYTEDSNGRWFRYEPIKWRVLTTNYNGTGKALLLAEKIMIASPVGSASSFGESQLRTYLNSIFYYSALSGVASSLFTKIDTTQNSEPDSVVFLLREKDVNNSENGLTDLNTRIRSSTDYAKYTNANSHYSRGCTNNCWWLWDYSTSNFYIKANGEISYKGNSEPYFGVVPAIVVTLPKR